ncbi:MAG: serine/threonine-protein kinase, partial [Isosphaeraceae bacterium]
MSESARLNLDDIDLELARRIDAICRRYEAERRVDGSSSIENYLGELPEAGRQALRQELEALERELRAAAEPPTDPDGSPVGAAGDAHGPPVSSQPTVAIASSRDAATEVLSGLPDRAGPDAPGPVQVRDFGDYEILRELARGGMGIVFLARQVSLNRPVALKMILAGQLADEADVRRFYSEAEAAANLDHPGIVPIHEVGQHQGQHYFSMGFVDGPSLAQRLADGPIPPREAAELMARVAGAIAYAHGRGLIHRDIKPGNILLDRDGSPRITDFGLVKKVEGDSALTASGQIMGTPSYMPPEQASGTRGAIGPPADVYAIGATLYALATGRPPFLAATPMDTILQVIGEEPVPPRRLNTGIPRDLETICLKCLEKDPARRYATAEALMDELRRFLDGKPILARPVSPPERAWRWARRNRLAAALLTVVALLTATGAATITALWLRAEKARQNAVSAEGRTRLALAQTVAAGEQADRARA